MRLRAPLWLLAALGWAALSAVAPGCAFFQPPDQAPPPDAAGRTQAEEPPLASLGLGWRPPPEWERVPPAPGHAYLAGWRKDGSRTWLWALPGGRGLEAAARELASGLDFSLVDGREVSWLGRPAWTAELSTADGFGRLRAFGLRDRVVVVAGLAHQPPESERRAELARAADGLYLVPPGDLLHVVQHPRETLSLLALWYTGEVGNWPRLQEHNRMERETLDLGQIVLVPADLVRVHSPLPAWAVGLTRPRRASGPAARRPAPAAPPPEPSGTPAALRPAGPK
jgi:hypothetical protein